MSIPDVHLFGHLLLRVPITVVTSQLNSGTFSLSPVLASSSLHIISQFLAANPNVSRDEFFLANFQWCYFLFSSMFGLNTFDPTSLDVLQSQVPTPVPGYFG